jgi:hypothetical protein
MASKKSIIDFVNTVADATEDPQIRVGFGKPGSYVEDASGETKPTGMAFNPEPTSMSVLMEGIAKATEKIVSYTVSGNISNQEPGSIIEMRVNGMTITLDAATEGKYIIKATNKTGMSINGTIDGVAGPHSLAPYQVYRVYYNGTEWMTW